MTEEKLMIKVDKTDYLEITLNDMDGEDVTLNYKTLANNKPNSNAEYVGLWRTSGDFDLVGENAKWSEMMRKDAVSGSELFEMPISQAPHVIGYCPTGDPKDGEEPSQNVAAIITIDADRNTSNQIPTTINLEITGADTDVLELKYSLIPGMLNKGHYIKIWKKPKTGPINFNSEPFYKLNIGEKDPKNRNRVSLSAANFSRGTTYVLRYYFDDKCKHLVGIIEFSI